MCDYMCLRKMIDKNFGKDTRQIILWNVRWLIYICAGQLIIYSIWLGDAIKYIEIDNLVSAELPTDEEPVEEILLAEGVLHLTQVDMEDSSKEEETSISVKGSTCDSQEVLKQREFTTESDIRHICNI